ncbi:PulJ/GspJ family protein [Clostridium magnum]|uniref:Prepilin-type N-terminal cleavage/methylation domain-containing protein n=1 Tax=Clostridium magnum DSM 2767 TaxID=1121326 RepID=A0A162U3H5_9CLOT|nr:prepilin-type N-terminal cleavage/methylation domain-containing protein [Clostridium magnum]KZL93390.1 hypothetical protein CLMAG_04140 [Clostridium magnum DSM 2767]SHI15961.1 prepilin-type N-terminal cleavage/methylation domain-containing protein [Clostridium magnum DSM 2767]
MKKKGFTLIELMITIAVFSVFSMYLYQVFFSQIRESFSFNNNINVQYNANKALNMLTDEIRNYSFTNLIFQGSSSIGVTQVSSNGKVLIDLNSSTSNPDIYYNSLSKSLSDNNGNQCFNINSIQLVKGTSNDENELILIVVSASKGKTQITSSTAVNIKR